MPWRRSAGETGKMTLKDWKLNYKGKQTINYFHSYDKKTNDGELVIYKEDELSDELEWRVKVQIGVFSSEHKFKFKTKSAALRFAKSYMRTH